MNGPVRDVRTREVRLAMRISEAREWIQRVRAEGHTRASGMERMNQIMADIEKRRGKAETDLLRAEVEKQLNGGQK